MTNEVILPNCSSGSFRTAIGEVLRYKRKVLPTLVGRISVNYCINGTLNIFWQFDMNLDTGIDKMSETINGKAAGRALASARLCI